MGVVVVSACASDKTDQPIATQSAAIANRNLDLLFMVDNSSSMRLSQTNLLNNFPTFITALQGSAQGLPNIHIAVVSSDMGAGDGSVAGCDSTGGNNGIFQYTNRAPAGIDCTANALNMNETFISNIGGQANYTGNLATVFTCIAALGETGCGFEHQFASVLRALGADGSPPPQENQQFLRKEAYLVVIFITNEDDCSAAPGNGPNGRVPLFDTSNNRDMASQLGPPQNFRCNEFGHTCPTGVSGDFGRTVLHPNRNAPNNDVNQTVSYDGCMSDDSEGYLLPVTGNNGVAAALKGLKSDQSQVLVAAITGAPTPYQVHWKTPSSADTSCGATSCPWPEITHSCTATDSSFADPGVRVAQLVQQFGANGLLLSICDQSFAGSLMRIGELINASLQPPCVQGKVATKPNSTDPDCAVVSHTTDTTTGNTIDSTVPWCNANNNAPPCWSLMTNGCANNGYLVNVSQDPMASSSTAQNATVNCALCTPGIDDPARGCCADGSNPQGTPACCPMNPTTMQTACAS